MAVWACWGYLAAILGVWLVLANLGDRWWPATLILFGPRWVWAIPPAFLAPAALMARGPRLLWPVGGAAAVVLVPVMGLCVPWRAWLDLSPPRFAVRVLTLNTELRRVRPEALAALVAEVAPDVVALQEQGSDPELAAAWDDGWHTYSQGELFVASRFPIEESRAIGRIVPGGHGVAARLELATPAGPLTFVAVHLESPRRGLLAVIGGHRPHPSGIPVLDAHTEIRAAEAERISEWIAQADGGAVLIAGDLNMTTDSAIFRRCWSRYADAFAAGGLGFGNTEFLRPWTGVRIDHILSGPGWRCRRSWVGPDVGSDHRPLVADLDWVGVP